MSVKVIDSSGQEFLYTDVPGEVSFRINTDLRHEGDVAVVEFAGQPTGPQQVAYFAAGSYHSYAQFED